jgi:hypothetical protein
MKMKKHRKVSCYIRSTLPTTPITIMTLLRHLHPPSLSHQSLHHYLRIPELQRQQQAVRMSRQFLQVARNVNTIRILHLSLMAEAEWYGAEQHVELRHRLKWSVSDAA